MNVLSKYAGFCIDNDVPYCFHLFMTIFSTVVLHYDNIILSHYCSSSSTPLCDYFFNASGLPKRKLHCTKNPTPPPTYPWGRSIFFNLNCFHLSHLLQWDFFLLESSSVTSEVNDPMSSSHRFGNPASAGHLVAIFFFFPVVDEVLHGIIYFTWFADFHSFTHSFVHSAYILRFGTLFPFLSPNI
jgi:hypothetical protein